MDTFYLIASRYEPERESPSSRPDQAAHAKDRFLMGEKFKSLAQKNRAVGGDARHAHLWNVPYGQAVLEGQAPEGRSPSRRIKGWSPKPFCAQMEVMRTLTDHIVEGDSVNHQLVIEVTDEPGQGGANHRYEITGC